MRKVKLILMLVLLCVLMTGCISDKTRDEILDDLVSRNYIRSDWEFVNYSVVSQSPLPGIWHYDYIYKDADDLYYVVQIYGSVTHDEDTYYPVHICENITLYDDGQYSNYLVDSNSTVNKYHMSQEKFLFFEWWKIEEEN